MSDARHPSFPSGAGGVWFGPALAVVIAVLLIWKPFESAPLHEEVSVAARPHLAGTLELETGTRLRVSLDPLHEDPRRQEFDGPALARRLGLPEGEPWRLRLEAVGASPEAALEGVQVVDGDGACLAPILDGVTPADLAHHGGSLEFDSSGELSLNGDTGISAGIKDELLEIRGEPRIVPLYTQVTGPGNNAQYTLVKFVGVRICEAKLTGPNGSKRVMVQPTQIVAEGRIPGTGTTTSSYVYSPTWILH